MNYILMQHTENIFWYDILQENLWQISMFDEEILKMNH